MHDAGFDGYLAVEGAIQGDQLTADRRSFDCVTGLLAQLLGAPSATLIAVGVIVSVLIVVAFDFRRIWWHGSAAETTMSSSSSGSLETYAPNHPSILTVTPCDSILESCGSNSVVEFLPSKQAVAGSNPVSRSNRIIQACRADSSLTVG